MAIIYKKENGFPIDIRVETCPYEDVMEDNEVWSGFESIIIGDKENIIASFKHKEYRGRLLWVGGFMEALKYKEKLDLDKKILALGEKIKEPRDIDKSEGKELINKDGSSNLEVGDWIVTKEKKVLKIEMDDQENLPFEIIKKFASLKEIENAKEINELVNEFKRVQALNKLYESELHTESEYKINEEIFLEERIEKLRK